MKLAERILNVLEGDLRFEVKSGPTDGIKKSSDILKKNNIEFKVEPIGGKGQEGNSLLLVSKADFKKARKLFDT